MCLYLSWYSTLTILQDAAALYRVQAKTYKEIRDNLSEGVGFYMSLQEAIAKLRQQVGDHCMTRKVQRYVCFLFR